MNRDNINKNSKHPIVSGRILLVGRKWRLFMIDALCYFAVFFTMYGISSIRGNDGSMGVKKLLICALLMWGFPFATRLIIGSYNFVWRYANYSAYLRIVFADAIGGAAALLVTKLTGCSLGFWCSVSVISVSCVATLSSRFLYQFIYKNSNVREHEEEAPSHKIGVAIVGAGRVGALLADELLCNPKSHYTPVCFVDKNSDKIGSVINGVPVYEEGRETINRMKNLPIQEVFIAIPDISNETAKLLYDMYSTTGCKVKLYDFPLIEVGEGNADVVPEKRVLREFKIEDLLFRKSIDIEKTHMADFYSGKTVLVTGGGGSIGSEICRQIAKLKPKKLIILDIYENNAYNIQQELIRKYGKALDLSVEIASVRDRVRLDSIFAEYRPDIVFHAAAHKHVPLMEHSGCEAIKNNVLGTYNTADMAEKYGTAKFILISTDKAVNPTNIMGASKRMCEMVIQMMNARSKTDFVAVRFGNVLGSNGSVIPLFKKQIEQGGPVTVTHPDIIRYFMTIPEAVSLVLQAGAYAKGGEIFVLDMGEPVKILDLAKNLIRLSGYKVDEDIKIEFTGLRPGEKLYEELLMNEEGLQDTPNKLIHIGKPIDFDMEKFEHQLQELYEIANRDSESIKDAVKIIVPTYVKPETVNERVEKK